MTLRCGCYDQADDIVFGPNHQCTAKPALTTPTLDALVASWRFVVPETSEGVAADNLQQGTYDPDLHEARIHQVLSPDELEE